MQLFRIVAFTHQQQDNECSLHTVQNVELLDPAPGASVYLKQGVDGVDCLHAEDCPVLNPQSPAACHSLRCWYCDKYYLKVLHFIR